MLEEFSRLILEGFVVFGCWEAPVRGQMRLSQRCIHIHQLHRLQDQLRSRSQVVDSLERQRMYSIGDHAWSAIRVDLPEWDAE